MTNIQSNRKSGRGQKLFHNTVGAKQEQKLLVLFSTSDWHHHVLLFVLAGKMNCGTQSYILCPASFVAGRLQPNPIHHYDRKNQGAGDHNKNLPKRLFSYLVIVLLFTHCISFH